MSSIESCTHNCQAPTPTLNIIHDSQGGTGRHRCVVCAYSIGFDFGQKAVVDQKVEVEECQEGSFAPKKVLATLPEGQGGTGRHKCTICAFQLGMEAGRRSTGPWTVEEPELLARGIDSGDFIPDEEGRMVLRQHISYERSQKNRARAIELHGTVCSACGFDFDLVYGAEHARSYIEVHHLVSITRMKGETLDPAKDLVPLCSNCHSMAHRSKEGILSVTAIKELLKKGSK